MNKSLRPQKINWTKIAAIGILLAIVGYQWYQKNRPATPPAQSDRGSVAQNDAGSPAGADKYRIQKLEPKSISLEAASGRSDNSNSGQISRSSKTNSPIANPQYRPSNTEANTRSPSKKTVSSSKTTNSGNSKTEANTGSPSKKTVSSSKTKNSSNSNTGSNRTASNKASSNKSDSFLQPVGGNNLKSPAGLIYGMGPRGEHRVEHVMLHSKDNLGRPSHGVFDGDKETILKAIDEAYELVKTKSKYVKTDSSQGNTSHTVSLGRRIGFEGGEKGQRSNNAPLKSIRLILEGDRVITAYPYR